MTEQDYRVEELGLPRESILEEAQRIINGQRRVDYGGVSQSFNLIGGLWAAYLGVEISAHDVVNLMVLLKVARAKNGFHRDSYVDIAGYAGCAEKLDEEPVLAGPTGGTCTVGDQTYDHTGARQWDSLVNVPQDVRVRSAGGCTWTYWTAERAKAVWGSGLDGDPGWLWSSVSGAEYDLEGPFTEVLDG